jgi:IS30 family transposase
MKHKYKQLNLAQRYQIEALLEAEQSQTAIATLLQVNKSTISRELSRNIGSRGRCAGVYNAARANRKTANRHKSKIKSFKLTDKLKSAAREWKEKGIAGVSHETLYKWIWEAKSSHHRKFVLDTLLYKELRHGKRRRKRGNY